MRAHPRPPAHPRARQARAPQRPPPPPSPAMRCKGALGQPHTPAATPRPSTSKRAQPMAGVRGSCPSRVRAHPRPPAHPRARQARAPTPPPPPRMLPQRHRGPPAPPPERGPHDHELNPPGRWRCYVCQEQCGPGWQHWFMIPPAPPWVRLAYAELDTPPGQPPRRWIVLCWNCWRHNPNAHQLCYILIRAWEWGLTLRAWDWAQ